MDQNQLAAVAGILLSLVFSYIPGVHAWYVALESRSQSLVMLAALAVVTAGVYGLSCAGWSSAVTCDSGGVKALVSTFVAALVANQATYVISPQPKV